MTSSDLCPPQADGDEQQRSVEEVRRVPPQADQTGACKREDVRNQCDSSQRPGPWAELGVASGQQERHRKHASQRVPGQLCRGQEVVRGIEHEGKPERRGKDPRLAELVLPRRQHKSSRNRRMEVRDMGPVQATGDAQHLGLAVQCDERYGDRHREQEVPIADTHRT